MVQAANGALAWRDLVVAWPAGQYAVIVTETTAPPYFGGSIAPLTLASSVTAGDAGAKIWAACDWAVALISFEGARRRVRCCGGGWWSRIADCHAGRRGEDGPGPGAGTPSYGELASMTMILKEQHYFFRKAQPSVIRTRPPVGLHSTCAHLSHLTSVCA